MKKQFLLLVLMILPLAVSAEIIECVVIDNIRYNLNTESNTAEVREHSIYYSGHITIPETVTYKDVVYNVTSIRWRAFHACYGLSSVSIPNSVTTIGDEAFSGCSGLTSINIPSSVTTIGDHAFDVCRSLTKVIVPDIAAWCGIKFGDNGNPLVYAYHLYSDENTEIKDLVIPNSVTQISSSAFKGCSGLTSVTFGDNVNLIGNNAFQNCSGLTSITFGDNVMAILSYAFYGCSGLTSLTINNNIGPYAFADCTGLTSVTFGDNVKSIGNSAFSGCSGLSSVILPEGFSSIGNSAFDGCRLENVLTKNTKVNFSDAFSDRTYQHAMLYIPEGTWGEAVYEYSWYQFNHIREAAMTSEALSSAVTYTLMDAKTFGYATYDAVSDEVRMAKAFYSIDEQDVNNSWQVKTRGGRKYIYSIGAKKYASITSDGHISLSATPVDVAMTETGNGIMIGTDNSRQWAFIKNGSYHDATGIDAQPAAQGEQPGSCYTLDGQHLAQPKQGLNIIKMSNGKTKKVMVR